MANPNGLRLFAGRAHPALAEEIAKLLQAPLGKVQISTFPDSETHVQIGESVRGADIFIIQPTCPPVNENLMELLVMLDAFRRASAGPITAVVPYYGYARQDRKVTGREPITARLVADLLASAGASRVVSVDLHVAQIQGFFDIPMDHLTAMTLLASRLHELAPEDAIIVSPDVGGMKRVEKFAGVLNLHLALMHKKRSGVGGNGEMEIVVVGEVQGRTPIIVDDLIAGGSIRKQARALAKAGAKPAIVAVTHALLVGKALQWLNEECIERIVVTNTVPVPEEKKRALPNLEVLSVAPLLAEAIRRIHNGDSLSAVFENGAGVAFAV